MNIFNSIMTPFIRLIKEIFLFAYSITGNYGVSIILLSFSISLLLLPVFILIEKAKKKDDSVKQKMKPLADEIKRCYKGQERYYYLRTLNRQHNYRPIRSMIPTLSLLLQIPFFIAAYQFLEHFKPLNGASFLFFKNLAAPDALVGSINVLPIVMTLVNLITAWFYTRNGKTSERKQMLIVAGIFLVLLYKLPSGLVLYWTMNNVFSFFRLFITNPEVFKKRKSEQELRKFSWTPVKTLYASTLPKLSRTFVIVSVIMLLAQFNWAFQNNFNEIGLRIAGAIGAGFLITIVLFILALIHRVEKQRSAVGFRDFFVIYSRSFRPMFFIIFSAVIFTQINWAIQYNFNDFTLRILVSIAGSGLVTLLFALLILYYRGIFVIKFTKYNLNLSFFPAGYYVFLIILALGFCYSQINWALINSSFKTIVPRLTVALILSWLITILTYNVISALKRNPNFRFKDFILFARSDKLKLLNLFFIIFIILILFQINRVLQLNLQNIRWQIILALIFSSIVTLLVISVIWIFKIHQKTFTWLREKSLLFFLPLFLGFYFHLASLHYYTGFNFQLSSFAYFFVVLALIHEFTNFKQKRKLLRPWVGYSCIAICLIIIAIQVFNINVQYIDKNNVVDIFQFIGKYSRYPMVSFINYALLLSVILAFFYKIKAPETEKTSYPKNHWGIYILAILYLTGFIFLWNPLAIYSTYPDNFEFPAVDILKHNFNLFIYITGGLLILYFIIPKKIKTVWLIIILTITCIGFIHNTLLPINMGTLQENKFVKQDNMAQPVFIYFLEAFSFLGIVFFLRWILQKKYIKQLGVGLLLLNVVLITQSLIASANTGSFMHKPKIIDYSSTISFSKDKENVVYLLTDMFHGWYMNRILQEDPELKDIFEGFVWHPNTISISYTTAGSIPVLLNGYDYTIDKLNQDDTKTYEDKMTDISYDFFHKIKSKNYRFTSTKIIYSKIDKNLFDAYLPTWNENWDQWNSELNIGVSKEIGYTLLWENAAFYTAPLLFKPSIYNDGKWFHGEVITNENTNEAKPYNFLRLLPYISHSNSDKPNFIFLYSIASHHPWDIMDKQGIMHNFDTPYKNNKWVLETLAKWIKWMKENDVYDNTKIVIFSDHGPHWKKFSREIAGNMPLIYNDNLHLDEKHITGMFPLLLTKDFNQRGILKTDSSFTSNADAYYFAFNEKNPYNIMPPEKRVLPFSIVVWERELWRKNQVHVNATGTVKSNVFDLHNWKLNK